jgi:hypothetical protein
MRNIHSLEVRRGEALQEESLDSQYHQQMKGVIEIEKAFVAVRARLSIVIINGNEGEEREPLQPKKVGVQVQR